MFPWTMCDFSLMDAIECGASSNCLACRWQRTSPSDEMPMFRNLWENNPQDMPKKGRGQGEELDR